MIVARLEPGDDVLDTIEKVAASHGIRTASLSAIGALSKAKLAFFDRASRTYKEMSLDKDLEIVSCVGNVCINEGKAMAHMHMSVADESGSCYGGHVRKGCQVSVTMEVFLIEAAEEITREKDSATGLSLMTI
jgi:predicted DNA-binding protein with PD1-like motif